MSSKTESISQARWRRLQEIFDQAVELDTEARAAFLNKECAGDDRLRRELDALLESNDTGAGVIENVISRAAESAIERREFAATGQRIGPYRLLSKIGQGGMGAVYLAERDDQQYHMRVAIKLLHSTLVTDETELRFRSERQILANLEHPNIGRLIDGGNTSAGVPYLVMEYIDGEPIHQYCDHQRLSIDERLDLFRQICSAVEYAHRSLVVHRDIKPSNILVTADGVPKLLDFGIAKILDTERVQQTVAVTQAGDRLLTPDHASPEQVLGRPVTTASDVYSLGILLYELLSGHRPYRVQGVSPAEMERIICLEQPELPSKAIGWRPSVAGEPILDDPEGVAHCRASTPEKLARRLRGDLDTIVLMALRKEPERRYASVGQFAGDIHKHLQGQPVAARSDTWAYRSGKFVSRNRFGVAAISAFVMFLVGFGATMWVQAGRIAHQRDTAESTLELIVNVFERSDPYQDGAGAMTAREILLGSKDKIARDLADQPEVRAMLREKIGRIYVNLSEYQEAVQVLEQSLATRRALYGDNHAAVAASLSELGTAKTELGEYAAAIELQNEALQINRRVFGDAHPSVADSLHRLGYAQYVSGDYAAAEPRMRQSIALYRELGVDDERVGRVISELGNVYQQLRRFDESDRLFETALQIFRKRYGDDHVEVGLQLFNLGYNELSRGDHDSAGPYMAEAIPLLTRALGDNHSKVGAAKSSYAIWLHRNGRLEEAEGVFRDVIANVKAQLGPEHETIGLHWVGLGDVLTDRGHWQEAELAYRRALQIYSVGSTHPDWVAHAHFRLGRMLAAADAPQRALEQLRLAFAGSQQLVGEPAWLHAATASALGGVLMGLDRNSEAEPMLLDAYSRLRASLTAEHPLTREALEHIVQLYRKLGRTADARRYEVQRVSP